MTRPLSVILTALLAVGIMIVPLSAQAAAKHAKARAGKMVQEVKENLVLMPLHVSEDTRDMQGQMEAAIIQGLAQKYEIFSGERVLQELKKAANKENARAKKDCDETRCLEDVAIALQTENFAMVNVSKTAGGYLLSLSIKNVMTNKAVFDNSIPCKNCDVFDVVEKLKELSATPPSIGSKTLAPPAMEEVKSKANDAETDLWEQVQKGNTEEDYQAYLSTYPKGKYLALAKVRLNKIKKEQLAEEAKQKREESEAVQQEQQKWDAAQRNNTSESYANYLNTYPDGRYAALAKTRQNQLQTSRLSIATPRPAPSSASNTEGAIRPGVFNEKAIVSVNGISIPQTRIDLRIKAAAQQGQADTPELRKAIRDDLINLEIISQEAIKLGLDKSPEVAQQILVNKQNSLVSTFVQNYAKNHPNSEQKLQKQEIQEQIKHLRANANISEIEIPQSRIDMRIKVAAQQGQADTPELRKAIRDDLINLELISQEAGKMGLDKSPEVIQQIELAKQSALAAAFVQNYAKNHPIAEATVQQEYENLTSQIGKKEYKVAHILAASEEEAQRIAMEVKNGTFAKVAKEKSKDPGSKDKGGDLGWTVPSNFVQPFGDAILKLSKGQISEPVQTQFGWHIIKLDDVRELKVPAYMEVKPNLEKRIQQQSIQQEITALRANAKIE